MTARSADGFARLTRRLRPFRAARGGNILILFALALIPMIGMVGVGLDYFRGLTYRAHFDRAADAAVITAIATARDYISTNPNNEANPTAAALALGQTRGLATFRVNAASMLSSVPLTPTLTVNRTGGVITATANYAGTFPSAFGRVFSETTTINVVGKSSSSLTLGIYTDFYLLLDTSGSMGFPTSAAQQISFARLNPDMADGNRKNCAFACHFPNNNPPWQGVAIAKLNNIELRIKTVSNAVQGLLQKAKTNRTLANQYRVGLFPFISYMETAAALTSDLDSLAGIDLENYMDIGDATRPRGSGGTHYDNVLPAMNRLITTVGDGTSASRALPFVFLITDGVANNQYFNVRLPRQWGDGSRPVKLDPSLCKPLKDRGITVSVLYIPYVPLETPINGNTYGESVETNRIIPDVPKTLQDCASTGYFRTASSASEIQEALNAMFDQATRKARLVASP